MTTAREMGRMMRGADVFDKNIQRWRGFVVYTFIAAELDFGTQNGGANYTRTRCDWMG